MAALSRKVMLNVLFLLFCILLLAFLFAAPEETTTPLPADEIHAQFQAIKSKKEADRLCVECHQENGSAPLADDHPPPYRCLFCHKRNL